MSYQMNQIVALGIYFLFLFSSNRSILGTPVLPYVQRMFAWPSHVFQKNRSL
jgi:hypothetical protein